MATTLEKNYTYRTPDDQARPVLSHDPETGYFAPLSMAPIRLSSGKTVDVMGIRRQAVANQVGCSISSVSRVLSGHRRPRFRMATTFATALGLTLSEFAELLDKIEAAA